MDEEPKKKKSGKGVHPNSLKNLKVYQKGHPPTGGRPKGSLSLKKRFEKYMDIEVEVRTPDGKIVGAPAIEAICLAIMSQAAKGNVKAASLLFERVYGKESQKLELSGKDGDPIEFEHSGRLSEIERRLADAFGERPGLSVSPSTED